MRIELKRIERACLRLLQPQARGSWLKKLAHISNTRAERALGSVFYPMHFIPKMADHQGCAPLARATIVCHRASSNGPRGLEARPIWPSRPQNMHATHA
jgi:hypothetical protein